MPSSISVNSNACKICDGGQETATDGDQMENVICGRQRGGRATLTAAHRGGCDFSSLDGGRAWNEMTSRSDASGAICRCPYCRRHMAATVCGTAFCLNLIPCHSDCIKQSLQFLLKSIENKWKKMAEGEISTFYCLHKEVQRFQDILMIKVKVSKFIKYKSNNIYIAPCDTDPRKSSIHRASKLEGARY